MIETCYEKLTESQKNLLDEAEKVMKNSYNPYSKFSVGAAILAKTGETVTGANVENSAYGSTICAERSAIVKANSEGIRKFNKIAIITKGEAFDTEEPSAPCGECRQVINEFSQISGGDIELILSTTKKNKIIITSINEILPLSFGPKDLLIDVSRYE